MVTESRSMIAHGRGLGGRVCLTTKGVRHVLGVMECSVRSLQWWLTTVGRSKEGKEEGN